MIKCCQKRPDIYHLFIVVGHNNMNMLRVKCQYIVLAGCPDWWEGCSVDLSLQVQTGGLQSRFVPIQCFLLRAVQCLVPDEVAEEGKILATLGAVKPFLSGVHALVDLQVCGGGELLPAVGARERPLPSVDHLMAFEATDLAEALPTLDALVRFLPRVDALVDAQLALVGVAA